MNPEINRSKHTERNLPTGVSAHADDLEEEDFPMSWEYSLLINDRGSNPTPLIVVPLGDRRLEGMVMRMVEEKILEADPVIPVVGYQSWTVTGSADVLKFLIRISTASREDKHAILDYVQSKDYPCHLLLNF